jgi:hypothetical protein
MVVTPRLENTPSSVDQTEPEPLSTPVSNETTASSAAPAEEYAAVPLTEDTAAAIVDTGDPGVSGDGSGLRAEPMPDVVEIGSSDGIVEIGSSDGSLQGTGAAASTMNAGDVSPAASGTPAVAEGGSSVAWASMALGHLDEAQQSMARGDYVGYGQSLGSLRSLLEGIVSGTAAGVVAGGTVSAMRGSVTTQAEESAVMAPTTISQDPAQSSESYAASTVDNFSSIPMVEPAAEAGTLTAEPDAMPTAVPVQEETSSAGLTEAAVPVADVPDSQMPAVARLVVISTGAELSLPDQEEITVGREDPSSGIFPDVDLTPYGGEEGGVSRRHARLLHIGDDYFVEDLQATNFTKLDGQRLPAHTREKIEDGARLDFGRVAVIFRRS